MGETVFAGSSTQSRESRILLVSLLQLPESKILIQEPAVSVRLFPRPTSPSVSFWQPQFSLLPTFLPPSLFPSTFSQQSFTRLAVYNFSSFFQLLSTFSHAVCLWQKIGKISDPLTISTSFTGLFMCSNKTPPVLELYVTT